MPAVPVDTRNRVETQPLDTKPLRYSRSRNYVGEAVQDLGRSMQAAGEDFDRIEATYDQADVLNLDNTFASELSAAQSDFANLRGDQPGRVLQDRVQSLQDRAEELAGSARSERARNMIRRALGVRLRNTQERMTAHADGEMFRFRDAALVAGRNQAVLDAIGASGTPQFGVAVGVGLQRLEERAALIGAPPEALALERTKLLDEVHGGVLDRMFSAPDPDIDGVMAYLQEHGGEMTPALQNETLARLQDPLQGRISRSDADMVMGFASPTTGTAPATMPGGAPGEVGATLTQAGFSPAVVAGFLGNFDVEGGYTGAQGDGGSASGIAQWRHERRENFRRQFGKDPHEATPAEQARFVVWEMQNPRAAGMTEAQRDAILAAQTPGEAAALIDQNYERSSGQHRAARQAAAEKYGGGTYSNTPRQWDRPAVYANLEAVAEREGWNPERIERARSELDRRINRDEGLLQEQQSDAYETAANIAAERGDAFRVASIPREVWNRMSPVQQAKLRDVEAELTKPKPVAAGGMDYQTLRVMQRLEPEKFKRVDVLSYAGRMTNSELMDMWLNQQESLRRPASAFQPQSAIGEAINRGKKYHGMEIDDDQLPEVYDFMEDWLRGQFQKNGKIGPNDADEALRTAMAVAQREEGWIWDTERRSFEIEAENVPAAWRERFVRNWQGSGTPSDEQVLEAYRRQLRVR
jgi:hypothetical protein